MGKYSQCCDQSGLKKGPWTAEEDEKLLDYIHKHGHGRWRTLPKNAGLKRCGKSCRLRWTNYLRPDIKRGKFSIEEEDTMIQLHSVLGNKWSAIAAHLPGRTDNEIKNYWNTHIKKRLLRMGIDPVTHKPRFDILQLYSVLNSSLISNNPSHQINISTTTAANDSSIGSMLGQNHLLNLAASFLSSQQGNDNVQENNLDHTAAAAATQLEGAQFLNQAQVLQPHLNQLNGLWQGNGQGGSVMPNCGYNDNVVAQKIITAPFHNLPKLMNYSSFLSTPSSSTTPLHSSSTTYVNGSNEDERDSYCSSSMLMFDHIPNCLDVVNGYML